MFTLNIGEYKIAGGAIRLTRKVVRLKFVVPLLFRYILFTDTGLRVSEMWRYTDISYFGPLG